MSTTVYPLGTRVQIGTVDRGPGDDLTDTSGRTGIVVDYPDFLEKTMGAPEDGHYIELEDTGEIVGLESRHFTAIDEEVAA